MQRPLGGRVESLHSSACDCKFARFQGNAGRTYFAREKDCCECKPTSKGLSSGSLDRNHSFLPQEFPYRTVDAIAARLLLHRIV